MVETAWKYQPLQVVFQFGHVYLLELIHKDQRPYSAVYHSFQQNNPPHYGAHVAKEWFQEHAGKFTFLQISIQSNWDAGERGFIHSNQISHNWSAPWSQIPCIEGKGGHNNLACDVDPQSSLLFNLTRNFVVCPYLL